MHVQLVCVHVYKVYVVIVSERKTSAGQVESVLLCVDRAGRALVGRLLARIGLWLVHVTGSELKLQSICVGLSTDSLLNTTAHA